MLSVLTLLNDDGLLLLLLELVLRLVVENVLRELSVTDADSVDDVRDLLLVVADCVELLLLVLRLDTLVVLSVEELVLLLTELSLKSSMKHK